MTAKRSEAPHLTVVGAGERPGGGQGIGAMARDGSAAIAVGGLLAGGFASETLKSLATGEKPGRTWFILFAALGFLIMGLGFWLRHDSRLGLRVGIIVNAVDERRGRPHAERRNQQAEQFSQSSAVVTLKADIELSGDPVKDRELVQLLADETLKATATAERLAPDAAQVNLIPTMPLHVAFWLGARLGHTHAQHVTVHEIRQGNGAPAFFFPATSLRAVAGKVSPLEVGRLERIDGGDHTRVALALDLQNRGDQFLDAVKKTCRARGIGYLLPLRSPTPMLKQDMKTFDGVVSQTCNAWGSESLEEAARTGHHSIFLSGPVAIAVALGARLAAPTPGRWTAYTYNPDADEYEPFPPLP